MAIIFENNKKAKAAKFSREHNYSSFWLDKESASIGSEWAGRTSNTVKALKLRKYQRAIANFVKILSKRDLPVVFKGTESYTDNQQVVLAADLSEKNFDVSAGLALHEASHLIYTDFEILSEMSLTMGSEKANYVKQLLNIVEDRRIDSLVFKSSPGYKAYYHKLYDHYFRNKEMANAVRTAVEPTYENYLTQLIGVLNPSFKANRLPGLVEIMKEFNINNIDRLKTTRDSYELSLKLYDIITKHVEKAQQQQKQEAGPLEGEDEQESENNSQGTTGTGSGEGGNNETAEGENSTEGEGEEEMPELTPREQAAMQEALRRAQQMVNGETPKKQAAHSLTKKLQNIQNSPIDYSSVGGDGVPNFDCIIHDVYKQIGSLVRLQELNNLNWEQRKEFRAELDTLSTSLPYNISTSHNSYQTKLATEGYQLGAILGRKLLTRREERSLEHNRLRNGKIDSKRVAHAGYGIETVFNQIIIDKYKRANIHLTLDASGSMGGERWNNSLKLAAALGKAVSMIDGLEIQISTRDTDHNSPSVSIVYDSRFNKVHQLIPIISSLSCNSMTPEGLCLEALLKKNRLVPTTPECDSYLINVCDGEPGFESYGGARAISHTRNVVKKINKELGIKHIGFFFGSEGYGGFKRFQEMYGVAQSKALPDANNAMEIAAHMNRQLMSK